MKIKPPKTMTRTERAAFRRLVEQLTGAGIDPAERVVLAVDFVTADARISELRMREGQSRGKARATATRSLNVALAERRRLHAALFAGARAAIPQPTPQEIEKAEVQAEADAAWRRHRQSIGTGRGDAEIAAEAAVLEARFGPMSWNALLYGNPGEQAEAEAAIARYSRRHRRLQK